MSTNTPNGTEGVKETGRVEAFSDGVFAIAVTLLVLNLNVVPEKQLSKGGLAAVLRDQWPMFLAYVISFAFILIMWINHHNMFRAIKRIDHTFLLLNGLLLLFVAFVPFTTELIASYAQATNQGNQFTAVVVYNGTYLLIAVAFNAVWRYAASGQRLLDRSLPPDFADSISRRYRFGPLMYLACMALGLVSVLASLALNVVLAIFFAWPHRVAGQGATVAEPPMQTFDEEETLR